MHWRATMSTFASSNGELPLTRILFSLALMQKNITLCEDEEGQVVNLPVPMTVNREWMQLISSQLVLPFVPSHQQVKWKRKRKRESKVEASPVGGVRKNVDYSVIPWILGREGRRSFSCVSSQLQLAFNNTLLTVTLNIHTANDWWSLVPLL